MGFQHLLDFNGYDHMLFLWMSFLGFTFWQYKRAFLHVTFFTLAHSLTLAFCVFQRLPISKEWVERSIALSIALQAAFSLIFRNNLKFNSITSSALIFFFGLIHGMGFSGLLISLLGHSESIVIPLIIFNLGLELGQVLFVLGILLLQSTIHKYLNKITLHYMQISGALGLLLGLSLFISRF